MAQNYEIDIKRFNGQDYDTLLPTPATHASTHQANGSDPITMQTGNYANGSVTAPKLAVDAVTADKLADSAKALPFAVTLLASGWSNNQQTINSDNFLATGFVYVVSPSSSSFIAYGEAQIYANDVTTDGIMIFQCTDVPTVNLTVNIVRSVSV